MKRTLLGIFFAGWSVCAVAGPFNGKNLVDWHCEPENLATHWWVENQTIVGENPAKKGSVLWTDQDYRDFELTLEFKTPSPDYDSGIFLRGKSHQVQIGVSRSLKVDLTGCIYAPKDGKGGYPAISDQVKAVHKLGEWNTLRIVVTGKRIQTFLNEVAFVDYVGETIAEEGPVGLQLHAGVHEKMVFRKIVLSSPEAAPEKGK